MNIKQLKRDPAFNNEEALLKLKEAYSETLKEEFFKNNIPFIKTMIYEWKKNGSKTNYDELMSLGLVGLTNAFNTYDSKRNCKFTTYAGKAIWMEFIKHARYNENEKRSRFETLSLDDKHRSKAGHKIIQMHEVVADESEFFTDEKYQTSSIDFMNMISLFTDNEKRVAIKFFIEGKEPVDIAQELGITRQAVNQTHKRNVKKLSLIYKREA